VSKTEVAEPTPQQTLPEVVRAEESLLSSEPKLRAEGVEVCREPHLAVVPAAAVLAGAILAHLDLEDAEVRDESDGDSGPLFIT
jgi:hypothetical protein